MGFRGENEDEMWDIYDENRMLTGKTHRRADPMPPGEYRLVVHVCIFNNKNQLLIQQRQPWKKGWPNMWDLSVGGSAVAGDTSQKAAERETKEEIGLEIDLTNVRPHFTINFPDGFDDYYFLTKDVDITELKLQYEEVKAIKWVDKEELMQMMQSGEMIPYYFLDDIFEIRNKYGSRTNKKCVTEIKYASLTNLPSWMHLVEIVRGNFPGLETQEALDEYQDTLRKNINRKSAICALDGYRVIGILLYSKKNNTLDCLAVHPDYRRQHIATQMISMMMHDLDRKKEIVVDTFREDDPRGEIPRTLYKKLGFVEGVLDISMDHPIQKFIYNHN